jgi:hypothetical protein
MQSDLNQPEPVITDPIDTTTGQPIKTEMPTDTTTETPTTETETPPPTDLSKIQTVEDWKKQTGG